LHALGRLLAVGSEWGSYASPIGGAAGRGLAREVAEEASEQLGRHSARQASRELKPVVIGEDMERVRNYAKGRYLTINDFVPESAWKAADSFQEKMLLNQHWIEQMIREGRLVTDIGPDFTRRLKRFLAGQSPASPFYELERRTLRESRYPHYVKRFHRFGKYAGEEF
jgi:hypothetical protein